MARNVRTVLFTSHQEAAPELRKTVTSLEPIRVVAELDEPSLIATAVGQFAADLLVADLDPNAEVVVECIRQLLESQPDLPVFALSANTEGQLVLRAMKAGVKEYLVKPLDLEELERAVGRHLETRAPTKEPGKLISCVGMAGGVGCTAIATNLAVELADLVGPEKMVCLADFDFRFGQVATLLDVHGQFTVADLCSTPEELDPEMIKKALVKHESGLYVLRRPHSFAQAEMITAAHCANVLTGLQDMCAYVVVDGPTRHDPGGRSVLDAADYNLFILQLLVTSVRNTDRIVQELGAQGFNIDRLQFVCNRVGRESAHLEVEQVETILDRKMYMTLSDDWKAVGTSINIGQPLHNEFTRSKVCQEIRDLAMKIHCPERLAAEAAKRGNLLAKFFRKGSSGAADGNLVSTGPMPASAP